LKSQSDNIVLQACFKAISQSDKYKTLRKNVNCNKYNTEDDKALHSGYSSLPVSRFANNGMLILRQ